MTGGRRTRVGAYALCLDDTGRSLLCRIAPAVAPGEVVELADVADRLFSNVRAGGRLHAIRIVYRVQVTGGTLRDEVDGSTDTCAWFTPTDAARLHLGELARRALALAGA